MDAATKPDIAAEITGALEWWRDAGVDCDFTDDPADWLAKTTAPEPQTAAAPPTAVPAEIAPPRALIGGSPEDWPRDLAAFQTWWLSDPSLDHGDVSRRVAPRGAAGAELMVLVADPEEGESEILCSSPPASPQAKLLAAIVAAMGLDETQIYVASALTRPTPLPDWRQLAADGLGGVVAHHVALVAPKRLLVFGGGVSSLLGHDPANKPDPLRTFNHDEGSLPLLAAMDLAALLARPRAKAGLWQRLLDWTGTTET